MLVCSMPECCEYAGSNGLNLLVQTTMICVAHTQYLSLFGIAVGSQFEVVAADNSGWDAMPAW